MQITQPHYFRGYTFLQNLCQAYQYHLSVTTHSEGVVPLQQISIRMLRYYDELGILVPEYINKGSGYRYCNPEQLSLGFRIQALKDMGFSLDTIRDMLNTYDDVDNLKQYLLLRYDEMEIEVTEKQSKLRLLKR